MGTKRIEGVLRQYLILVLVDVIELNEGDKVIGSLNPNCVLLQVPFKSTQYQRQRGGG